MKDEQPQLFSDNSGYNKQNNIEGITPQTWFGPLQPLPNFAPQSVTGRQWDFPVGYNMLISPRPLDRISFQTLRRICNGCDIMSIIINARKDMVESRKWIIRGVEGTDVDEEDPRIKEMTDFWKMPDKINTFDQWIRPRLDDLLVIDAPALYLRRNRAGGVYGLEVMDGGTIKLLVDAQGRRPRAPNPAFQQVLKGVPAISYTDEELLYSPRNLRSYDPYGRSPVEQTICTINAAINRAQFNRDYYTEGNIPDAIGWLPETFTPAQAREFTEWWDAMYAGNLAQKRKVKFVPGKGNFQQFKEPELKNVYDDYIARVLCFALGMSSQPFVSEVNRATAETQKEASKESGQRPIENSICNIINRVIQGDKYFNYPDLEFAFKDDEDPDPKEQAEILGIYVDKGIISRDAAREKIGEEPEGGVASELCITTASGIVSLEDADAANKQAAEQADQTMKQTGEQHELTMAGGDGINGSSGPVSGPRSSGRQKKAEKAAGSKKKSGKIHIAPIGRRKLVTAKKKAASAALKALKRAKHNVLRDVQIHLATVVKADDAPADRVSLIVDLDALGELSTEIQPILQEVVAQAGSLTLGSLDIDTEDLVNRVFQRAVDYAESRSAELVTQITETTRERLRDLIAKGLEDNLGRQEIANLIERDESGLFDEDRAQLIASYEIGSANGYGSLEGLEQAQDSGLTVKKEWYPDAEACPICLENAEAGPIPLDEAFPSGDDAPLAHPNCECSLLGVVE